MLYIILASVAVMAIYAATIIGYWRIYKNKVRELSGEKQQQN